DPAEVDAADFGAHRITQRPHLDAPGNLDAFDRRRDRHRHILPQHPHAAIPPSPRGFTRGHKRLDVSMRLRGQSRQVPGSGVEEAPELARPARVLQLAERLRLDLTDTLARHGELLADLLEG